MSYVFRLLVLLCFAYNVHANNMPNVQVKVGKVIHYEFYDKFDAIGKCQNEISHNYYAKVNGQVDSVLDQQGIKVKKGTLLISIDRDIAGASKAQAEAGFKLAEVSFARDQALFEKKVISQETLEKSKVSYQDAKLALSKSLRTYEDMVITAPFDGTVGVVRARVGDIVKPGDYLFSLIGEGRMSIFLELPESLYNSLKENVEVILTDSNNNKGTGRISATSNYLSDTGAITVKAIIDEPNKFIHGSYLNVQLIINKHQSIGIEESAIMKNDKGNFVYKIIDGNKVQQLFVKTSSRTDNLIEIVSDEIHEGDQIISEGLTKVADGAEVEIIK